VPVIRTAFMPTDDEILEARAILSALDRASDESAGVALLPGGRMVDEAMRRGAARTVAVADASSAPSGSDQ
jgi:citrate lyase beta subunit